MSKIKIDFTWEKIEYIYIYLVLFRGALEWDIVRNSSYSLPVSPLTLKSLCNAGTIQSAKIDCS